MKSFRNDLRPGSRGLSRFTDLPRTISRISIFFGLAAVVLFGIWSTERRTLNTPQQPSIAGPPSDTPKDFSPQRLDVDGQLKKSIRPRCDSGIAKTLSAKDSDKWPAATYACSSDSECAGVRVGPCCNFAVVNTLHYCQVEQYHGSTCRAVCWKAEPRCINGRCALVSKKSKQKFK